jgi:leader peptidase (prepilin peptidase)/N-methyltransferase
MSFIVSWIFGLIFGSFANVCIFRLPQDQPIHYPPSFCPACKKPLRITDNIPILSFIFLKGRCHACSAPISWQYPVIEMLMGCLFCVNVWFASGELPRMLILDLLTFYLLTISIIDYRTRIIPDELSLSFLAIAWVFSIWNPFFQGSLLHRLIESFISALAGGGGMFLLAYAGEKVFKKEALGGGDIKLVAGFGAALGWLGLWSSLLFGSVMGGLLGLLLLLSGKKNRGDTLPFGPFLSCGAFLTALFSNRIFNLIFP